VVGDCPELRLRHRRRRGPVASAAPKAGAKRRLVLLRQRIQVLNARRERIAIMRWVTRGLPLLDVAPLPALARLAPGVPRSSRVGPVSGGFPGPSPTRLPI